MLIAEPRGSKYLSSKNRKEVETGSQVIISNPLLPEFREFALLMHDGVRLLDKDNRLIIDPEPLIFGMVEEEQEEPDFEDQGSRGFNYRNERFSNRVKEFRDIHKVFSSKVFEDPSTPLFLAYPGDPITIRFVFPADRGRAHTFVIHGHKFPRMEDDLNSSAAASKGQNTIGSNDDLHLLYGAGGFFNKPGDYMYRSGNIRWDVELGLWGIIRVLKTRRSTLAPLKVFSEKKNYKVKKIKKGSISAPINSPVSKKNKGEAYE